ncbi:hypothetical protein CHS0354_029661, partial [Potamilus streckersoni]
EIQKLKALVLCPKTSIDSEQTRHSFICTGHTEDILYHAEKLGTISKIYDITYLVFDEAHCILEWRKDFRPKFERFSNIRPKNTKLSESLRLLRQQVRHHRGTFTEAYD